MATADNEKDLLEISDHATAAHIEKIVGAWRRVDRLSDAEAEGKRHESRYVQLFVDDDGMYVLRGRLDPDVGEVFKKALEAAGDALYGKWRVGNSGVGADAASDVDAHPALEVSAEQRRADAVGLLEASGLVVSAETSRRLSCDASLVVMTHAADGASVLDVGRKRRTVPPPIRRALDHRDGGYRFPGCGLEYTDAHHLRHWADGGETKLDNLVLMCRRHHRAVHEDGFRVELDERGRARFWRPDGSPLPAVPRAPRLGADPVADLEREHRGRGVTPTPHTTTPLWNGEPLDLGWTIYTLRGSGR